jgi:hypothetical protein
MINETETIIMMYHYLAIQPRKQRFLHDDTMYTLGIFVLNPEKCACVDIFETEIEILTKKNSNFKVSLCETSFLKFYVFRVFARFTPLLDVISKNGYFSNFHTFFS